MNYRKILKKLISINIILHIVLIGFFSIFLNDNLFDNNTASGTTIIVSKNGGGDYGYIQKAINNAKPGDIIRVWAGNYNENLIINKEIKLIGNGSTVTKIIGSNNNDIITINNNNVTLSGFNITYTTPSSSNKGFFKIKILYVNNVKIENNIIYGHNYGGGIVFYDSSEIYILNNSIINNHNGIEMLYSVNSYIKNNSFINNQGNGIIIFNSNFNEISNNSCLNNIWDGIVLCYSDFNNVSNNNCSSNKMRGICLLYADSNIIFNNTCNLNQNRGIEVTGDIEPGSQNNILIDNTCINNYNSSLLIKQSYSNKIEKNYFKGSKNHRGIYLYKAIYNTVKDNVCDTNFLGNIRMVYSDSNIIINNSCIRYGEAYANGIDLIESKSNHLTNNTMKNCTFYIYGFEPDSWNTHNIDISNTIDGRPIIYWSNQVGGVVPYNGSMIILANSSNVEINGLKNNDLFFAIHLGFSNNNFIHNNDLSNGISPIILQSSNSNKINNNVINNSSMRGIQLINANGNVIENNSVSYIGPYFPLGSGIRLEDSDNNFILNNSCNNNNLSGIDLFKSKNNIISNNNFSNNIQYGIYLNRSSDKNIVTNNVVNNNSQIGLYINNSNSTKIYHNNFINNKLQASVNGFSINNHWDNSNFEGNYWSNYKGLDNGSDGRIPNDGIGDTNIPHLNLDQYPFINRSGWYVPGIPKLMEIIHDSDGFDSDGNYTIMWQTVRGALNYILEQSNTSLFNNSRIIYNGSENIFKLTNKPSGKYFYRLKGYNKEFDSSWSNIENITVNLPPETPNNFTLTPLPQGNAVNISWTLNKIDTIEYEIFNRKEFDTKWKRIAIIKQPNNSYIHDNLIDNQKYEYKIRARDSKDQLSFFSEIKNVIPIDIIAPSKPKGLKILITTHDSITFSWNPNNDDDLFGYRIYRRNVTNPYKWWDLIGETDENIVEYNDTGLVELTEYHYVITAIDEVPNESEYSMVITGRTKLGLHTPFINNSFKELELYEDTVDYTSLNIFEWFKDINNDPLIFRYEGSKNIIISINPDNGVVIVEPKRNWCGNETITFYCSDGEFEIWDNITITVIPVNDPPGPVKIKSPIDGIEISENEKIKLVGSCSDPDTPYGDILTFNWSSDRTGHLGHGPELSNVKLPSGKHKITLQVIDISGNFSTTSVNITVQIENPEGFFTVWLGIGFLTIFFIIISILIFFNLIKKRKLSDEKINEYYDINSYPLDNGSGFIENGYVNQLENNFIISQNRQGLNIENGKKYGILDVESIYPVESRQFLKSYLQPQLVFQSAMVGRDNELNRLQKYLETTIQGKGSAILISGEAGIGKSRLVFELFQLAQKQNFQILTGSGVLESLTPYMVFIDALKPVGLDYLFSEETPRVEGVYLVSNNGLLIKEVLREETKLNPNIFASMLTAVSNFVKESLSLLEGNEKDGYLKSIGFENYRILIESGKGINLVILLSGKENDYLIKEISEVFKDINEKYGNTFQNWDGEENISNIEDYLNPFVASGRYDGIKGAIVDPKKKREHLFDSVVNGLINESQKNPIILCLENLHWLDPSSLSLFHYITNKTKNKRIFIIGTYRPENLSTESDQINPLTETLFLMKQDDLYSEINLRRLGKDQIEEMLISIFSSITINKNIIDRLYKETEGNPLFIIQLIKYLIDERIFNKENGTWEISKNFDEVNIPPKIYNVIIGRIDRLDKKSRRLLDVASVIGETFASELLIYALKSDRLSILEQLKDLEKVHKLIYSYNGEFRFTHSKIKETIYSELPSELRAEYHLVIARSIERLNKDDLDKFTGGLAFHYYNSNNRPKALRYLYRAAKTAKLDYSLKEALRFYIQALEIEEDRKKMLMIFEELGIIYNLLGNFERSKEMYDNAINLTTNKLKQADIHLSIGKIYAMRKEYRNANNMYSIALKTYKKLGKKDKIKETESKLKNLKK